MKTSIRHLRTAVLLLSCLGLSGCEWYEYKFGRMAPQSSLRACVSNLQNLQAPLEMYFLDHDGVYPETLDELVPNYLKSVPTCPTAGSDTYSPSYRLSTSGDMEAEGGIAQFSLYCSGSHHQHHKVPPNHPRLNEHREVVLD